jgi:1,4-alpha-glucan branching enzyme
MKGYFNLVLHAHLPFVRHPERTALEERWLFEAISESYIPLIEMMQNWKRDELHWQLTLSISPTLSHMLRDTVLQQKYWDYLTTSLNLARAEQVRADNCPTEVALAGYYERRLRTLAAVWTSYHGDLTQAFKAFADGGNLEVITTSATHSILPLILTEEAVRAQISSAVKSHAEVFGSPPRGFWLPECAYRSSVENVLREFRINYFFLDTDGFVNAEPNPVFGVYAPLLTKYGLAVFGRDPDSAEQIWNARTGYPGDPDYREFYRDIGYDRPFDYLEEFLPEGVPVDTGLKYHRVTGGMQKAYYDPITAREKAHAHAADFVSKLTEQVNALHVQMDREPIVTAMFDAELFGHWWFEGPHFLDSVVRLLNDASNQVALISPSRYLMIDREHQVSQFGLSTWGRGGYLEGWLNPKNHWVYRMLHQMELRLLHLVNQTSPPLHTEERILQQALRELFLAQSSDWAFILDHQSAVDYALARIDIHRQRFDTLCDMLSAGDIKEEELIAIEGEDNLLPDMDLNPFRVRTDVGTVPYRPRPRTKPVVLMLAWEYPPDIVGGLARHMGSVAPALVEQGYEIHVMTRAYGDEPYESESKGLHVHRAFIRKPHGHSFLDYVLQLNMAFIEKFRELINRGLKVDLVHAHDWLVGIAAKAIKSQSAAPLVTTIHATEFGRNQGLHHPVHYQVHGRERSLVADSDHVIVCSQSMRAEVHRLFDPPVLHVIPNGVSQIIAVGSAARTPDNQTIDPEGEARRGTTEPIVLFMGRMVYEKGVDILLDAVPSILDRVPSARFVCLGSGPMLETWREQAAQVSSQIEFLGFVTDDVRNDYLQAASVCVFPSRYEPFGIVALEAMATGVPVVVSDVGGFRENIVHEWSGLTFYSGNSTSLSDQVLRLLLSEQGYRERLIQNAQTVVKQKFTWEAVARQTSQVYQGAMGNFKTDREGLIG